MKTISALALAAALCGSTVVTPMASATTPERQSNVQVQIQSANGNGCRPGDGTPTLKQQGNAVSVSFPDFSASVGAHHIPERPRQRCSVTFDVRPPSGYTYGVVRLTLRGVADIRSGYTGRAKASARVQGQPASVIRTSIEGANWTPFKADQRFGGPAIHWAPCGSTRMLASDLELSFSKDSSSATGHNQLWLDGDNDFVVQFSLKKC